MNNHVLATKRSLALAALVVCACVCALFLSGCGQSAKDAQTSIREGIESDMQSLMTLDSTTTSQIFSSDFTAQLTSAGVDPLEIYGPLFSSLSYTIDGIDVDMDAGTAVAHLTITNKDLTQAFQNYQDTLTDTLASSEGRSEISSFVGDDNAFTAYLSDVFNQMASDSSLPMVTTKVDVTYQLQDGTWVAGDLDDLQKALLGGLDTSALSSLLTSAEDSAAADAPTGTSADTGAAGEVTDAGGVAGETTVDGTATDVAMEDGAATDVATEGDAVADVAVAAAA